MRCIKIQGARRRGGGRGKKEEEVEERRKRTEGGREAGREEEAAFLTAVTTPRLSCLQLYSSISLPRRLEEELLFTEIILCAKHWVGKLW